MNISSIMNKVITIDRDLDLLKIAKILAREKVGSLVMVKDGRAVGIITERDILKNITCLKKKMSKVMIKTLICITSGRSLESAADLMHKKKIKRLLVVDAEELVGIITATDLIANADMLNRSFSFFE